MRTEEGAEPKVDECGPGFVLHPVGMNEVGRFLWRMGWDPLLTEFRKTDTVATVSGRD